MHTHHSCVAVKLLARMYRRRSKPLDLIPAYIVGVQYYEYSSTSTRTIVFTWYDTPTNNHRSIIRSTFLAFLILGYFLYPFAKKKKVGGNFSSRPVVVFWPTPGHRTAAGLAATRLRQRAPVSKMRSANYPRVSRAVFCSALLLSQHVVVDANNWATGRSRRSSTLAVMQPGGRDRPIRDWKAIKRYKCAAQTGHVILWWQPRGLDKHR